MSTELFARARYGRWPEGKRRMSGEGKDRSSLFLEEPLGA